MYTRMLFAALLAVGFFLSGCGDSDDASAKQSEAPAIEPPVDVAKVVAVLGTSPAAFDKVVKNPANGSVYALSAKAMGFKKAAQLATRVGGVLIDIDGAPEQAWITSTFGEHKTWLGLERTSPGGPFAWHSGIPLTFTQWSNGEPNNWPPFGEPFALMGFWNVGEWNDVPDRPECQYKALVEFKPEAASTLTDRTAVALRDASITAATEPNAVPSALAILNALNAHTSPSLARRGVAVVVGIDDYTPFISDLTPLVCAVVDSIAISKELTIHGFDVIHLTNGQAATSEAIRNALKIAASKATAEDILLFAFSGHGFTHQTEGRWTNYLCPRDLALGSNAVASAFSVTEAAQIMGSSLASSKVMLLDACRSTVSADPAKAGTLARTYRVEGLQGTRGIACLFATAPGAIALERPHNQRLVDHHKREIDNGLFTHFFLIGIKGAADVNTDKNVTIRELSAYVGQQLSAFSVVEPAYAQEPYLFWDGPAADDIVLASPSAPRRKLPSDVPDGTQVHIVTKGSGPVCESGTRVKCWPIVYSGSMECISIACQNWDDSQRFGRLFGADPVASRKNQYAITALCGDGDDQQVCIPSWCRSLFVGLNVGSRIVVTTRLRVRIMIRDEPVWFDNIRYDIQILEVVH